MADNISITSAEAQHLIKKHGAITYKGICELKGIPPGKKTTIKTKPISNKNLGEIKMLLRLAGFEYVEEFKFHPTRKWRFDLCFPDKKLAVEYEGIFSKKSRHTTVSGYSGDVEKYNAVAALGWKILRYTAKNFTDVVTDVKNIFLST